MRVRAKNKVVGATAGVLGAQPAGREGTKVRDGDRQRTGRVRVSIERNGTPRGSAAAPTPTHDTGVAPAGPPRRPRSHPPKRTGKGDHIVEPDLVAPAQLCDRHVAALAGKGLTLIGAGRIAEGQDAIRAAMAFDPWLGERHYLRLDPDTGELRPPQTDL